VIPMEFMGFGFNDTDGTIVMLEEKERCKIFFNTRVRKCQAVPQ
jgi:hypothetical protein